MGQEIAFMFEANEEMVELRFPDGTSLRIDRAGAEKSVIKNSIDRKALDSLAYNHPLAYVQLMLRRPRF